MAIRCTVVTVGKSSEHSVSNSSIFVNHGKDELLVSSCISLSSKSSVIDHPIEYLDALEFLSLPFGIILAMVFSCLARVLKNAFSIL